MKRILLICTFLLLTQSAFSSEEPITALIRIEKRTNDIHIRVPTVGTSLPTVFASEEVRKKKSQLENGSEAIVEGKINYQFTRIEGSHYSRPYFVISEVKPISLKALGATEYPKVESRLSFFPQKIDYIPPSIPLTTEVASAITLTTSVLLMNELTSSQNSRFNNDLNATLFLTTGIFATILFIYEQIEGKK